MNLEGTRRVIETTNHETANQYLRFGWTLINQFVVEATLDQPAMVHYVLASLRRLEDTRQVVRVQDVDEANQYLALGWKLIDKYVTARDLEHRDETLHFLLAWQNEDAPPIPGATPPQTGIANVFDDITLDDSPLGDDNP